MNNLLFLQKYNSHRISIECSIFSEFIKLCSQNIIQFQNISIAFKCSLVSYFQSISTPILSSRQLLSLQICLSRKFHINVVSLLYLVYAIQRKVFDVYLCQPICLQFLFIAESHAFAFICKFYFDKIYKAAAVGFCYSSLLLSSYKLHLYKLQSHQSIYNLLHYVVDFYINSRRN